MSWNVHCSQQEASIHRYIAQPYYDADTLLWDSAGDIEGGEIEEGKGGVGGSADI